jgi:hypothetical protein
MTQEVKHECPNGTGFSCPVCNPNLDKETSDTFFQMRVVTLLGYATALLMDYKNKKPLTPESIKKLNWFFENMERVIYKKLPMTDSP